MTCEKCKNKKATLFFADEGGGRHALCASCGATLGKTVNLASHEKESEKNVGFFPEPTLSSMLNPGYTPLILTPSDGKLAVCTGCGITSEEVTKCGELGCAECYVAFSHLLYPPKVAPDGEITARMPYSRRKKLENERLLLDLKRQLRLSVESENYELAATLRDRIRSIENN